MGRRDMLREGAAGGPEILPPGPRDRARDAPRGWSRDRALEMAEASGWPPLDLSLGVPAESPPELSRPGGGVRTGLSPARYPLSAGSLELRTTAADYLARRFRVTVSISAVAACAGAKEFISTVPSFLRASRGKDAPERDLALIPALGYPPYEFGARLAGLTVRRVPVDAEYRMDLDEIPDRLAARALYMWVNSPSNPTGVVERRLDEVVEWGRERGVLILSDEAYAELTWRDQPRTALAAGLDGVLAVHSAAKRSNAPGLRVGFFAGDPALVAALLRSRRMAGLIAAEESQRAAVRLFADDGHAAELRARTAARLAGLVELCNSHGLRCAHPDGSMFLWAAAPGGDGVTFADNAATRAGLIIAPGIDYGPTGSGHVRLAAVHDPGAIEERLGALAAAGAI
ncbi:MAG TPA: aminotransferase class I/II-fold pyridoxal phosphate-dependent enzyme [Streptosporangiaceae bacterium]|nr:aminotransferase class I/II-fold pyridoxal phosphate-dependent enzyme [Streptosporangiaceae bacterium]